MGTHMKTTIELSDALFHSAKELASKSQTTMRALVEEGLRRVLNDAQAFENFRCHFSVIFLSHQNSDRRLISKSLVCSRQITLSASGKRDSP